ncbi:MAG: M42 family metallopeptidase [Candidatus Methanodesulfokora sp.]|jgi:endoglucanase
MEHQDIFNILRRLASVPTVTGYERNARETIEELLSGYVDDFWTTPWDNSMAVINPMGKKKLLFAAHVDQIGFIVTNIDESGYLKFSPIGGWDARVAYGSKVTVITSKENIRGVIGTLPPHLMKEKEKKIDFKDLVIDIGVDSKEEAEKVGVKVGDYVCLYSEPELVGKYRVIGSGMDDKAGLASIIYAARMLASRKSELGDISVYFVATVQEEIGLRGASMIGYELKPDLAVIVDVTHAKTPETKDIAFVELGKGPVISIGPIYHREITESLIEIAERCGIRYQREADPRGAGTDAWAIQIARGGVKTGLVSVPNRYMHSGVEMVDLRDMSDLARLLVEYSISIKI